MMSEHDLERIALKSLAAIADELGAIRSEIAETNSILRGIFPQARSATLTFKTEKGTTHMPLTVHVNDKPGTAIFTEFDGPGGTGNKVPPVGAVSFTSSDPAVATVDATTGALGYLTAGSTTISGMDAGNSLTASDVLTVIASVAVSATLTLQPGV
jgi:hypothetical protein